MFSQLSKVNERVERGSGVRVLELNGAEIAL